MSLLRSFLAPPKMRATPGGFSIDDYLGWLSASGMPLLNQTWATNKEVVEGDFAGAWCERLQSNSVVFACLMTRVMLFSQARFQFQQLRGGRPAICSEPPTSGSSRRPEPGRITARPAHPGLIDADMSGDWFGVRRPGPGQAAAPGLGDDPDRLAQRRHRLPRVRTRTPRSRATRTSRAAPCAAAEPWALRRGRGRPLRSDPGPAVTVPRHAAADRGPARDRRRHRPPPRTSTCSWRTRRRPTSRVKFPAGSIPKKAKEAIDIFEQEHAGA